MPVHTANSGGWHQMQGTLDVIDANDGLTSLREAINEANSNSGAETITFSPAVFTTTGGVAESCGVNAISGDASGVDFR